MYRRNKDRSRRRSVSLTVEPLETRMAPAVLVNAAKVTFEALDGSLVTVTSTKPILAASLFTFSNAFASSGPQQL